MVPPRSPWRTASDRSRPVFPLISRSSRPTTCGSCRTGTVTVDVKRRGCGASLVTLVPCRYLNGLPASFPAEAGSPAYGSQYALMANIAKLKKRALDFEQKKQFDKALEIYMQILSQLDEHVSEADMALYNRVGDLLQRKGDIAGAVDHYEKAVDLYTESGFFNNAIALCNKVLRNAPGRTSVYYQLGRISAKKGFINDAKQNFLEYADRMQQAGDLEEAFRALKEFADLCPDQDDIRLMLADQLVRKDRKSEAIDQLQRLYEKLQAEGRGTEARATLDRMRTIDPAVQPRSASSAPTPRSTDLVFLDVDYDDAPEKGTKTEPPRPESRSRPAPAPTVPMAPQPVAPRAAHQE